MGIAKSVVLTTGLLIALHPVGAVMAGGEEDMLALRGELEDLRSENRMLQEKLESMGERLESIASKQENQEESVDLVREDLEALHKAPPVPLEGKPTYLDGIEIGGFVDTSFVHNFNEPDDEVNDFHIFDKEASDFNLDLAEIVIERAPDEETRVGFRLDVDYGETADLITSAGAGGSSDFFDLEQGFITAKIPTVGNDVELCFGKWVTLLGAEVIESPSNFNFSRSFLFGYAIPYTHTGLLATYPVTDELGVKLALVNGWDVTDDNNHAKTGIGQITFSYPEPENLHVKDISVSLTGIHGAEQAGKSGPKRSVGDIVATVKPTDELTLNFNYDLGREEKVTSSGSNDNWEGFASIVSYEFTDWFTLSGRYEYFDNDEGTRTATTNGVILQEFTLTAAFKCTDLLTTRLEYRHDYGNYEVFTNESGTDDDQDLVAVELFRIF
ncbi:MAG: porin [Candidatus Omnitrophica bacterium]|nr:porin [Candidatus Omnitrophota bacterium]